MGSTRRGLSELWSECQVVSQQQDNTGKGQEQHPSGRARTMASQPNGARQETPCVLRLLISPQDGTEPASTPASDTGSYTYGQGSSAGMQTTCLKPTWEHA